MQFLAYVRLTVGTKSTARVSKSAEGISEIANVVRECVPVLFNRRAHSGVCIFRGELDALSLSSPSSGEVAEGRRGKASVEPALDFRSARFQSSSVWPSPSAPFGGTSPV